MTDEADTSEKRFRALVYGIVAIATMSYAGWLGSTVLDLRNGQVRIETTIVENKSERTQQISEIRARLDRIEADFYERRARQ